MGMLSEKMSIEREQSASSGSDVPGTFNANTEDGAGTPATAERASPVSSEDSIAERPRSATLGSAAAPDRSEGVSTSNPTALQQAADGIAVLANSVAKHADPAPAEGAKEASPSGRLARAYRSVSREDFDATASRKGTNAAPLDSYQVLEAKIRSDQSAKSSPLHEGSNPDEEAPDPPANDGPPQFITTKPAAAAAASGKRSGKMRRRGKWTVEEEAYVARVIQDFNSGFLDAPAGTTLRTYLSDKLNCDPMRITKKFTGEACIGKRVFHPAIRSPSNAAAIDKAQSELEGLERRWRSRLETQQRESAKKAAASAAAAAAAANSHGVTSDSAAGTSQNPILQTASWLDRAQSLTSLPPANIDGLPRSEVMNQMAEVQKLLNEGSTMQRTSAELSHLVDQTVDQANSGTQSPPPEPADKRLRTGAEDAEALVGFLRSVRASAASGQEF